MKYLYGNETEIEWKAALGYWCGDKIWVGQHFKTEWAVV